MKKIIVLIILIFMDTVTISGQWMRQDSITLNNLTGISFVNAETGWAIGDNNILLKTTDGGMNWSLGNYRVFAHDYSDKIVVIDTNIMLANIFSLTGAIPPYFSNIYRSTNGGLNWSVTLTGGTVKINSLFFLDNSTGYSSDNVGRIFRTYNQGASWYPILDLDNSYNLTDIQFINYFTGWVVSGLKMLKTSNSGVNWMLITLPVPFYRFHFFDESTGFGWADKIMKSTNGGLNWKTVHPSGSLMDLEFSTEFTGWCVGREGKILKTTNRGENWFWDADFSGNELYSIEFINSNTGWIVGEGGLIIKTSTGGNVFISQISSLIPDKFSLHQNYPNPFNPSTRINYELRNINYISLKVFDLLGKEVALLVNEKQNAGSYAVDFNSAEFNLPSGIYFYTLNAGEFNETKKMVLVK